jgi:hypothetical protein
MEKMVVAEITHHGTENQPQLTCRRYTKRGRLSNSTMVVSKWRKMEEGETLPSVESVFGDTILEVVGQMKKWHDGVFCTLETARSLKDGGLPLELPQDSNTKQEVQP